MSKRKSYKEITEISKGYKTQLEQLKKLVGINLLNKRILKVRANFLSQGKKDVTFEFSGKKEGIDKIILNVYEYNKYKELAVIAVKKVKLTSKLKIIATLTFKWDNRKRTWRISHKEILPDRDSFPLPYNPL